MEKIISYGEIPFARGQSVYLKMEDTDPSFYIRLMSKGYRVIDNIKDADDTTIFITGRRQDYHCHSFEEYKKVVDETIQSFLKNKGITKPMTKKFNFDDLINHQYQLPFVLKNENRNGGKEKFLIETEEDYENLILACQYLLDKTLVYLSSLDKNNKNYNIDYLDYFNNNFSIQEYIHTPSEYNTTVRLLTSSSNDLLYAALKYKKPDEYLDDSSLLGYLLNKVYPLRSKSIVSNTLSGGENILIGQNDYLPFEESLLAKHSITSDNFTSLVESSQAVHGLCHSELGLLCGFDYIYDVNQEKWFLLEYHSKPMVGDYSKRQGLNYVTKQDRITADARVRATALALTLKK